MLFIVVSSFGMSPRLTGGLRQKAHDCSSPHFRQALFIAAENIKASQFEIITEVQASTVKGVGPAVLKELWKLGLSAATSSEAASPKRTRQSTPKLPI